MYRVFLSYNTSKDEMVVVWRLQTLAAASGLHLDVPNPVQRADWASVAKMIEQADAVIAFITKKATTQVNKELSYALQQSKQIIPIVESGVSIQAINELLKQANTPVFWLDPASPWAMEQQLTQYLNKQKVSKESKSAILALAGVAIGLLLLQDLTSQNA